MWALAATWCETRLWRVEHDQHGKLKGQRDPLIKYEDLLILSIYQIYFQYENEKVDSPYVNNIEDIIRLPIHNKK